MHGSAKQEGTQYQADGQGGNCADQLATAISDQGQGEGGGQYQQEHLCPDTLRVATLDIVAPAGRETETGSLQHGTKANPQQGEQALAQSTYQGDPDNQGQAGQDKAQSSQIKHDRFL